MVTEKQLKEANEKVYGVDHNYLKEGKPFQNINGGQKLNLAGQNFIVLSTSNDEQLGSAMYREPLPNGGYRDVPYSTNDSLGFSGMAVAPINKGVVDYGNVTVVAAATNPASPADLQGAAQSIFGNSTQYDVAERYLLKLMKAHPDWQINQLSGYSQSAYMLKIGAKYRC